MTFRIYSTLRAMGVRPALAYRLSYMEAPRTPTESRLMFTARNNVV